MAAAGESDILNLEDACTLLHYEKTNVLHPTRESSSYLWIFRAEEPSPIGDKIERALTNLHLTYRRPLLFQIWIIDSKGIFVKGGPFAFTVLRKSLCSYRLSCHNVDKAVGSKDGPVGRVIDSEFLECCHSMELYRKNELIVSDTAGINGYVALPVFEISVTPEVVGTPGVVGVVEVVSTQRGHIDAEILSSIYRALESEGLGSANIYKEHGKKAMKCLSLYCPEVNSIVRQIHLLLDLPGAIVWIPYDMKREEEVLFSAAVYSHDGSSFPLLKLRKEQGPAGMAFADRKTYYCSDISVLDIFRYPLVLEARRLEWRGSFALYLSGTKTWKYSVVLEFLLPGPDRDLRSPQIIMKMILSLVKSMLDFTTLKKTMKVQVHPYSEREQLFEVDPSYQGHSDGCRWLSSLNEPLPVGRVEGGTPDSANQQHLMQEGNTYAVEVSCDKQKHSINIPKSSKFEDWLKLISMRLDIPTESLKLKWYDEADDDMWILFGHENDLNMMKEGSRSSPFLLKASRR